MILPRSITVDGPAGSGKSSICSAIAQEFDYLFVDTGAFYRAVTLAALRATLVQADESILIELAKRVSLDITPDRDADNRQYTILLDHQDVTWEVRTPAVDAHVSRVSSFKGVRAILNSRYRELASRGRVIMAGRDIGSVVLPDADVKVYLDASMEARAKRRYEQQIAEGREADLDQILSAMRRRDHLDTQNTLRAPDAHYVNTDSLNIDGVVAEVRQIILNWKPAAQAG